MPERAAFGASETRSLWEDAERLAAAIGTDAVAPTIGFDQHRMGRDWQNEAAEELLLKSFERTPLFESNLLSRRNPLFLLRHPDVNGIADIFQIGDDERCAIVRLTGVYNAMRMQLLMTVSSEPVIAGDEIAYWTRIATFMPSEADGMYRQIARLGAREATLLDADDVAALRASRFHPRNGESIARYLADPARRAPLFLFARTRLASPARARMFSTLRRILAGFGAMAEGSPAWVSRIAGEPVASNRLFVCPPPASEGAKGRQIAIEPGDLDEPECYAAIFAPIGAALLEYPIAAPHWIADPNYAVPRGEDLSAALDWMPVAKGWRRFRITEREIARTDSMLDAIGWDIHAPAPPAAALDIAPLPDNANEVESVEPPREANRDARKPIALDDAGLPLRWSDLEAWAAQRLPRSIVLTPRALRAARKCNHPNPDRVAAALLLLATARWRMSNGDRDAAASFNEGLRALRLRDGFSNAELLRGRTGDEYVLEYDGRRCLLDRHLASFSSGFNDPKLIRIYYFWCKRTAKIVVGHLPTHLTNTQS